MKSSRRNQNKERTVSISLSLADFNKVVVDNRSGLLHGPVEKICSQLGISISKSNKLVVLTAPRDRLQLLVERLHFGFIKYTQIPR